MFKLHIRFVFYITLLLASISLNAKTLKVASDYWCPFICDNASSPGILIEVINEIALSNHLLLDIKIIPLSRALKMADHGEIDIVLALTQQHVKEFNLQQSHEIFGGWYNDFYALNDTAKRLLNEPDSKILSAIFRKYNRIGLIKGYEYGDNLDKLFAEHPNNLYYSTGNAPLKRNIKLLQKGRIDFLLDSRFNLDYQLSRLQIHDVVRVTTEGTLTPLYLGFNAQISHDVITLFDDGINSLQASGKLNEILKTYHTESWYLANNF